MMANIQSRSISIFLGVALLLLAANCSNVNEPRTPDPDEGREKSVVDISLSLGESWDIDDDETRAAPPVNSTEDDFEDIKGVNKVRVVAFRRKEGDNGEFYYDMKNDMILNVTKKGQGEHKHSIANGTLTKTYGYEYRVIAFAYSSTRSDNINIKGHIPSGEDNWMEISGDTYSSFCAKLETWNCSDWSDYLGSYLNNTKHINPKILQTPQIFYGTLHSGNSNSDIIPYAEENAQGDMVSTIGLKGILKRGVARVDIKITPVPQQIWTDTYNVQWITVLVQTPNTKVGLSNYDDFLTPTKPLGNDGKYTAVAYLPVGGFSGKNEEHTISFWLLPCKTKLAIRVKTVNEHDVIYLRNGQLKASNVEMHGQNGTGIVSPDLIDGDFYFRRNHKYVITIKSSEKVLNEAKLD